MSRIGKKPVQIPAGVTVTVNGTNVHVKGPKGELDRTFSDLVTIKEEGEEILVSVNDESREANAQHGLTRTLIHNMVVGVSEGFKKELQLVGIGFRSQVSGKKLVLNIGYSHPVEFDIIDGIEVKCTSATEIEISGIDKQLVGEFAANVRASRKPEPYKGKGVRYKDEHVRRKEGKTAGKK